MAFRETNVKTCPPSLRPPTLSLLCQASTFNSSISLTRSSIIFYLGIITIALWARRGGSSPRGLVTVCVPPAGLRSGRICETLTDNPFIRPVKHGWQMCLHIPKMPTIFKAMGEWRSRQRIASWQAQSSSCVSPYHSQILRRDSELNLMACWFNDSGRAYMVSV